MVYKDDRFDNLVVSNSLVVPKTRDVTDTHLTPLEGIIVYNEADDNMYIGTGTSWEILSGAVSLASAGGETLVSDGAGPDLVVKGLEAGAGISVVGGASTVVITNTDTGSAVTLASAGLGETLVNDGVGPALATKSLVAGAGITLASDADTVTVTAPAGAEVTLTNAGGGPSLVTDGTGPTLSIKSLNAASNIAIVDNPTNLNIDVAAPGDFVPTITPLNAWTLDTLFFAKVRQYGTGTGSFIQFWVSFSVTNDVVPGVGDVLGTITYPIPGATPHAFGEFPVGHAEIGFTGADHDDHNSAIYQIDPNTAEFDLNMAGSTTWADAYVLFTGTYILA
jgi:hypothetical protein